MASEEIVNQAKRWREQGKLRYCVAEVRWTRDDRTHEVEVKGLLGVAPGSSTIILYPVRVYQSGHWGKGETRRRMAEVRHTLLRLMAEQGYTRRDLTEPLAMKSLEYF
jgi:hypothetical protein